MKITIAHLPAEDEDAAAIVAAVLRLQPDVKVRKSDRHSPFKHIYLTTRKSEKPRGHTEKT